MKNPLTIADSVSSAAENVRRQKRNEMSLFSIAFSPHIFVHRSEQTFSACQYLVFSGCQICFPNVTILSQFFPFSSIESKWKLQMPLTCGRWLCACDDHLLSAPQGLPGFQQILDTILFARRRTKKHEHQNNMIGIKSEEEITDIEPDQTYSLWVMQS
jgi:hypothetical protein